MELITNLNLDGVITNCGKIVIVSGTPVEILSPSISYHEDNIVTMYFMENGKKIELCYASADKFVIYKFKGKTDFQHYWSRDYEIETAPLKYREHVQKLISIFRYLEDTKKFEEAV